MIPVSAGPVHRKTTTGPILDPDLSAQAFGNQPTFPCQPKNQEKTETSVPISFKCSELLKISLVGLVVNRHLALFSSSAGDHGLWVQSPLERVDFFPWKINSTVLFIFLSSPVKSYVVKWPRRSRCVTPMMMPHPCPSASRLLRTFFKSHNFFIMEK